MLEFTRDGASGGPKAIVWTENEKIVYPNLHVYRNWWIFSSVFKKIATSQIKPCTFLRRTPTENKVESNLHTIASADVS